MKFCPNFVTFAQIMILWYISDMTKKLSEILRRKTNFVLKSRCSLKKKKFELLFFAVHHRHLSKFPDFAQIFRIAARKIMVLPKYFFSLPEKP